ncbi:MAG TPA: hypothetical protein VKA46_34665 [Gemmataceae bacterium]|nr:hypothetical protein [Gemmataceae bacterium]
MPSTTCSRCRRVNPADAAFCYFDGHLLNGHGSVAPVAAGRQAFPHPFVFPSGRQCRTYDELALGCQEEWGEARALLRQGHLERFFRALGRADLARAARDAARAADEDQGLDGLLDQLPTQALQAPYLHLGAPELHLGTLAVGADRRFELRLENRGMRLLRGTVTCDDSPWLVVGEGAGAQQKLFQFTGSGLIPVRVVGQRLRAGNKPLEGRLVIDSNGGSVAVVVRAEVPIRPFPDGVLKGAVTPRQIAEKSKAAPKDAAPFFENGAVAKWYKDNGWTYPVQGPAASGIGAVQQFFEALGLTPPPKVEVSTRAVNLMGAVGERVEYVLQVTTAEKRPVYAHGVSDQPWLKVGRADLQGRTATLPLAVSEVPDRPGERLQAQVTVFANGNQRFPVTVSLTVEKRSASGRPQAVLAVVPAEEPFVPVAIAAAPVAIPAERKRPRPERDEAVAAIPVAIPAGRKRPRDDNDQDRRRPRPAQAVPLKGGGVPVWAHLAPVGALLLALFVVLIVDFFGDAEKPPESSVPLAEDKIDPNPLIEVSFHDKDVPVSLAMGNSMKGDPQIREEDATPAIWEPSMRFGVVMVKGVDGGGKKKLTRSEAGKTNNTVIRLDDVPPRLRSGNFPWVTGNQTDGLIFGDTPWRHTNDPGVEGIDSRGRWKDGGRNVVIAADLAKGKGGGRKSTWVYPDQQVEVTQFVEVVAGEQSRKLDTCLVRYVIRNNDTIEHRVGLRFLLDTFIGENDGVPFTVPGEKELCQDKKDFSRPDEVPDFVEALENADLKNPGTVARVQFRLGDRIEPPSRVTIGAWPDSRLYGRDKDCRQQTTFWEVPLLPINTIKEVKPDETSGDSAVVMYWDVKPIAAGASREVGFAYGLGNVAAGDKDAAGRLGLSVAGRFVPGGEFTLVAQVSNPRRGEELTLDLPNGFKLIDCEAKQAVREAERGAARPISTVTWKIKAGGDGPYTLKVTSSTGAAQALPVRIRSTSIFD